MTHVIKRQLKNLTFHEAINELEAAYAKQPGSDLVIYRETGESDFDGVPVCDVYTHDDIDNGAKWSMDDIMSQGWIFEDRGPDEEIPLMPEGPQKILVSRDDVLAVVNFVIGRFYYSNADAHKIAPDICKRLGFAEHV
jgi:hypothetical protein